VQVFCCAIYLLCNKCIVMNIRVGPPVTGDNFYPRPALITRILRALEQSHVVFLGPRRTGKTSCLEEILVNPPTGYVPILLNLEKHDSVIGWLGEMVAAVRAALDKPGQRRLGLFSKVASS